MAATSFEKRHAAQVVRALRQCYPRAACALRHETPLQLLVATILSAQCTDRRVNQVTPALFRQYPAAADYAAAPRAQLEQAVRSTGFFRHKARHIQAACQILVARFGGQVPARLDDLVTLPGVGRKTAHVVLGTAFGQSTGVVVDTHVTRVARRLGLTQAQTADKIEQDLMAILPRKEWIAFSHRVIEHGRQVCKARKPRCADCALRARCPRIGVPA